jgi:hypothetical protein
MQVKKDSYALMLSLIIKVASTRNCQQIWRDVASDQLSAQSNSRSNSEKKASYNIEQHFYGFDIE